VVLFVFCSQWSRDTRQCSNAQSSTLKEGRVAVNILVADDSVTMRRILELTFQGEDARVTGVENGEAALRKASELTPDVVFADLSLPGMDGYAIASAIKAAPGLERTAVVVMASQKHPYDEEKGKAAGVDDHILKPFDTQHVIDRVKQVLSKPRAVPSAAAVERRAPQPTAAPAPPAVAAAAAAARVGTKTIAFGKPPTAAAPPAPVMNRGQAAAPAFAPAAAKPAAAAVSVAAALTNGELEHKLHGLGLTAEQANAVLSLSREVIERVVWEIVPDLAEALIKEEIRRLTTG
jgi:CheY-like chemotaxis protein